MKELQHSRRWITFAILIFFFSTIFTTHLALRVISRQLHQHEHALRKCVHIIEIAASSRLAEVCLLHPFCPGVVRKRTGNVSIHPSHPTLRRRWCKLQAPVTIRRANRGNCDAESYALPKRMVERSSDRQRC